MTAPRTPADAGIAGDGWQAGFLHALRASGNVSAAARAAGTCRSRCYEARRRDPGFAAAWADALEEAADRLEMEAFRRAVEGVGEDRFFRGDVVGHVTRHYIRLSDDWGTLIPGNHHCPAYTMSLGADWRGTVSTGSAPDETRKAGEKVNGEDAERARLITASGSHVVGHAATKVVYVTPDISGFTAGVAFADAGASSKANTTDLVLQYGLSGFAGASWKVGYISSSRSSPSNADNNGKDVNNEYGVEMTTGPWLASYVQLNEKFEGNKITGGEYKQGGQELEVAYDATDTLKLNVFYFRSKVDKSTYTEAPHANDKYASTALGAKYTIAPGLWASLSYKTFKYTDADNTKAKELDGTGNNSGNAIRLRVHAGF